MAKHHITLGLPYHPRTRALIDGEIGIDGYELEITHDPTPGERHYRFAQGEWDVGEYSAATFLRTREKGFPYIALPIFFERGPRQRNIYYREGKLNHPSELKGKKIGCFRYGATAVVWARGFLLDEYGLRTTDMRWYVSGREVYIGQDLPVKVERLDPPPPFGQEKPHLAKLVSEGELQAALVAGDSGYLGLFGGGTLPAAMGEFPGVQPLFDDADDIIRWVRKTGIYPIIHLIALKRKWRRDIPICRRSFLRLSEKRKNSRQSTSPPSKSRDRQERRPPSAKIPMPMSWEKQRSERWRHWDVIRSSKVSSDKRRL
jgi:4,5-dihydroxyphthalate decarboxylase